MIRNIWCVGRNYHDHIKELGNEVPKTPLIFLKAGTSSLNSGFPLVLPKWSSDVQHEVELAFQFGDNLQLNRACVAVDLTLRDIQTQLKKAQSPWTLAKSFKNATPLGNFFDLEPVNFSELKIRLSVNNEVRQEAFVSNMIFSPVKLAQYICERFPVTPGDLILTGTPQGVSRLEEGDQLLAEVIQAGENKSTVLSEGLWKVTFE